MARDIGARHSSGRDIGARQRTADTGATGTGALNFSLHAVVGSGASSSTGTGALVKSPPLTVVGAGASSSTGTGVLNFSLHEVVGSGISSSTGTGALNFASLTEVIGAGDSVSTGTGALQIPTVEVDGFWAEEVFDEELLFTNRDSDFFVIHGTTIITADKARYTLRNGAEYSLPTNHLGENLLDTDCFIYLTSSRLTGMGATSGGGTQNPNRVGVTFNNPEDILSHVTLRRMDGGVHSTRVTWQILCYVGPATGAHRFWVRERAAIDFGSSNLTYTGSTLTNITDSSQTMVFITSQRANTADAGSLNQGQCTSELVSDAAVLTRGRLGDAAASYAVIEWGSFWGLERYEVASSDHGATVWTTGSPNESVTRDFETNLTNTITGTAGTDLVDLTRAFLHVQYRNVNSLSGQGNDDSGENVELSATNTLTFRRRTTTSAATRFNVIWRLESFVHPLETGAPTAQHLARYWDTTPGGGEQTDTTFSITAVSLDQTVIMGQCTSSDGTVQGHPRGHTDFRLTGPSTLTMTRSESNQEERQSLSLFSFPRVRSKRYDFAYEENMPGIVAYEAQAANPVATQGQLITLAVYEGQNAGIVAYEENVPGIETYE